MQVEKSAELDLSELLGSIRLNAKKVPRTNAKTPDYLHKDIAFEVTAVHPYNPQIPELERIRQSVENNLGNDFYVYMYSDSTEPKFKIIREQKCRENLSILRILQHFSTYGNKIVSKIDSKYEQSRSYQKQVIVLNFMTTPFDSMSIGKEVSTILEQNGNHYPSLCGVIVAIPDKPVSSVLDKQVCFYISNSHATTKLKELETISKIPDLKHIIMPQQIELFIHSLVANKWNSFEIPAPQFLSLEEIQDMGLPI